MEQTLNFIHLGDNARLVSGFSRKAYQLRVSGNRVTRIYGPVSVVGRKTRFDRVTKQVDVHSTASETRRAVTKIVNDRLAHGYRVAKPGEVPVNV